MDSDIKNKLISYLQNVEDFASDQIPDLLQQMITYTLFDCIFCSIVSFLLCYFLYLSAKKIYESKCDIYELFLILIFLVFCFFAIFGISKFEGFLRCFFAPKIFLLEYFMSLKG